MGLNLAKLSQTLMRGESASCVRGKGLWLVVLLGIFAIACSSSSSSDGASSDSGFLVLSVNPEQLEVGNLAFVDLEFSEVTFDDIDVHGLTLKFVLSEALEYVAGSAALIVGNRVQAVDPAYMGEVLDDDSDSLRDELGESGLHYLVFAISADDLNDSRRGRIQFDIRGGEREPSANIRVDLDRGAASEFDPENPSFDVEAEVELRVDEAES